MSYYNEALLKHIMINVAQEGKDHYQKFFNAAMKKFGIKSPQELSPEKKKEFFNYVDDNYKGVNEAGMYDKKSGIEKLKKLKKTDDANIIKIQKKKAKMHGDDITMYMLWTKNTHHSSVQNPYGVEMLRKGKKAAYLVPIKEGKMRPAVKKLLKQKGYDPIFQAIDQSKRQFKQMRYSRGEIQDTLIDMFGDEDPKILQKIKEGKLSGKVKKAVEIAIKMSGNMTGAVKKIEKIMKGLSSDDKVQAALRLANEGKINELDWNHDLSRMSSEIDKIFRYAKIKVIKHVPYKRGFRRGDAALYGAFITAKDKDGDKTVLPMEIDKKGIIRYAGGPSKWHPLEKIGVLNMSHARPDDYLKVKSYARAADYMKQFAKMPGFGQDVIRRKEVKESVKEVAAPLVDKLNDAIADVESLLGVINSEHANDAFEKIKPSKRALIASLKLLKKVK